jgi:secreted trypsin-like serine protease
MYSGKIAVPPGGGGIRKLPIIKRWSSGSTIGYVKPIPHSKCQDEWKKFSSDFEVAEKTICIFSDDAAVCMGDNGSPLLCNEEVTGVVSYLRPCGIGIPDVFTQVYFFNDWIDSVIKDN